MKKRFIALLLCCVMLFTLSPSLIASAAADDETVQQVEQTSEAKDTDQQPEQQPDQAQNEDKNETQATEEPKTEEPKTEEPKTEEPKTEEPKAEEPKAEEPKAEEPKAEDETTIPAAEQPDAPVESEIITPTVNFTNVAPFLAPVTGVPQRRAMAKTFSATPRANDTATENGMKISKTATANGDGSYTITLEAYATGSKVISEVKEDVPTDIVLVLDQSGSMADDIGTVSFEQYKDESGWFGSTTYHTRNQDYYEVRANGDDPNLYYPLGDGDYASVSVQLEQSVTPTKIIEKGTNNLNYWENRNNLYARVNGEYLKVTVTRTDWNGTYTYTLPNGTVIGSKQGYRGEPTFQGIDGECLYLASVDSRQNVYTYTYTDANGTTQTIGTSTGANTKFEPAFYQRSTTTSGGGSRLNALKNAATTFANAVAAKVAGADGDINTTADNINHRIAVVGFASQSGNGNNTELLSIAGKNSGSVGVAYNSITNQNLKDVLQSMDTQNGRDMVNAAITALAANGATSTDLGMDMAQRILNANPVPAGETRNRVVIVFTDGSPTDSNGFELDVANAAINNANAIKDSGATVYSIGIFSGADASSAGKEPDEDYYDSLFGSNYTDAEMSAACNWFMQKVSSNNGTPRTPSYYLSAGDSASLNNIFQQISDQIETGGSSSTLTSEAVVKDIIAPQFTLPEGATAANITLETYKCTGKSGDAYTWSKNTNAMGATATIIGDQVSVTGFDFAENYVGTVTENGNVSYRGHKLVISFTVSPKAGFLGGNNVYTNGSAGIYENGSAQTPVMTFNQPQVNVPIDAVTVTAADKNVYLLSDLTAAQLKDGAVVKCGDVTLSLAPDATNYGLEAWQTEYVNITVTVKDKAGNAISDKLENLTEDTTYTVEVTVAPKTTEPTSTEGTKAETKNGSDDANINVFKPVLTFQDSEVYYGDTAPDYTGNLTDTKWKHGTTEADTSKMGPAPELTLTYTPDSTKIADDKINTKQDIAVDVAVKIGNTYVTTYTTFQHTDCTGKTCTLPAGAEFLLHVKTCTLNITKKGGTDGEPYVFNIYKDDSTNVYTQVTIVPDGDNRSVTIYELPVGTYTIEEDTGWSWRYSADNGSSASLTARNSTGTITCTNTKANDYWLNGFSQVVRNIFGSSN